MLGDCCSRSMVTINSYKFINNLYIEFSSSCEFYVGSTVLYDGCHSGFVTRAFKLSKKITQLCFIFFNYVFDNYSNMNRDRGSGPPGWGFVRLSW